MQTETLTRTLTMAQTITATTYSEAGGVGKTTLTANLARARADDGDDVLTIDLDPQEGSLTHLVDAGDHRSDPDADNLVRHLVGAPLGDLEDIIEDTGEGFDIIPSHHMLEDLTRHLIRAEDRADGEYHPERQLLRVLADGDIPSKYDAIFIDPPATSGDHLYNAIYATRSLILPLELSGKGQQSVEGLSELVDGLERNVGIDVGVLAVVPNGVKHTTDQESYREEIEELGYNVPVIIDDRTSLMQGMWTEQCSAFEYVEKHRSRSRDYEQETLDELRDLADYIAREERGVEA